MSKTHFFTSIGQVAFTGYLLLLGCGASLSAQPARENINTDWKFHPGDCEGAGQTDFNDTEWRTLDVPHDWSIEGQVDRKQPAGNDGGYYPTGIGWYRKTIESSAAEAQGINRIYFEGVYMNAQVFVNGSLACTHPYGYTSFYVDATPYWKEGQNIIAVRVDNSMQKNCRWYSGSGIYRDVDLIHTERVHFDDWGIGIRTIAMDKESAEIEITAKIKNETGQPAQLDLSAGIGRNNRNVANGKTTITVTPHSTKEYKKRITIQRPELWSPDAPNLYSAHIVLEKEGVKYDESTENFGIRTIAYSAEEGFILNGTPVTLNGGCLHHDNGILGAAAYKDAEYRKARLMKEAGFNAARTSHNPPSESFLDACDELGLLVIDESFDGWRDSKTPHDYSTLLDQWWTRDLEAMVLRDRNHPSVFCWSIGNEIIERKSPLAVLTAHAFAGYVRKLDPTRPVTSALAAWDKDWEIYDPLAAAHDIVGYNYMMHKGPSDHERVPSRVMMQTESYPRDAFVNWKRVSDHSYIIGDFVWTSIDYLGESGIGRFYYKGESEGEHYHRDQYPWHGAYCGDIDLTGWRKPISHYRDLLYNPDKKLYMAVKEPNGYYGEIKETLWSVWPTWECWNWPGHEGKDIQVEVYSRYPKVRLYLNDELVGEQETTVAQEFKAVFTLPYAPGVLRVAGIENGAETETQTLLTAGKPAKIRLTADRTTLDCEGQHLAFITAEVTDKNGNVVPNAENLLHFSIKGEGNLIATGSADLKDEVPYNVCDRKSWKGRAIAVVKNTRQEGKAVLKVSSPGLSSASVTIHCVKEHKQ